MKSGKSCSGAPRNLPFWIHRFPPRDRIYPSIPNPGKGKSKLNFFFSHFVVPQKVL